MHGQALHGVGRRDLAQRLVVGVHAAIDVTAEVFADHGNVQDRGARGDLRLQAGEDSIEALGIPVQRRCPWNLLLPPVCLGLPRSVGGIDVVGPGCSVTISGWQRIRSPVRCSTFQARSPSIPALTNWYPLGREPVLQQVHPVGAGLAAGDAVPCADNQTGGLRPLRGPEERADVGGVRRPRCGTHHGSFGPCMASLPAGPGYRPGCRGWWPTATQRTRMSRENLPFGPGRPLGGGQ